MTNSCVARFMHSRIWENNPGEVRGDAVCLAVVNFKRGGSRVLWYQSIGFLVIIGVLWLDELQGLAEILFGGQPQERDWRGTGMATLVVIYIWTIVWGLTKRLVDRLHYL